MVIAAETGGALGGMVRQLSIDQFENEGRRVSYGTPESATAARKLLDRQMSINSVPKKVHSIAKFGKLLRIASDSIFHFGFEWISRQFSILFCFLLNTGMII